MERDLERTDSHLLHIFGRTALVLVLEIGHWEKLIHPLRHIYRMLIDMPVLIKWSPQASSNQESNLVSFFMGSACTDLYLYLMDKINTSLYIPEIDKLTCFLCCEWRNRLPHTIYKQLHSPGPFSDKNIFLMAWAIDNFWPIYMWFLLWHFYLFIYFFQNVKY